MSHRTSSAKNVADANTHSQSSAGGCALWEAAHARDAQGGTREQGCDTSGMWCAHAQLPPVMMLDPGKASGVSMASGVLLALEVLREESKAPVSTHICYDTAGCLGSMWRITWKEVRKNVSQRQLWKAKHYLPLFTT